MQTTNMSSTAYSYNPNKRTRRNVLVFPGVENEFAIDEDDYNAICDSLSRIVTKSEVRATMLGTNDRQESKVQVKILEKDEERRFHK